MLKLMYITNCPKVAQIAEKSGVDRIFIDLEIKGKEERQGHLDTVISRHNVEDISKVRDELKKSELLVRINPINEDSEVEIDEVIKKGANVIMLPFFKTCEEVQAFIKLINKRAKTCLLLETPEAVEILDDILQIEGIDEIHIGLNDLHLGYKMKFMFEPLANGMVENICQKIKSKGIKYGFGGVARVGEGTLPAEHIIMEHYRLGSSMVILSRSFCNCTIENDIEKIQKVFKDGIENIRREEKKMQTITLEQFESNKIVVQQEVKNIVDKLGE